MRPRRAMTLLAGALLLASCAQPSTPGGPGGPAGGTWTELPPPPGPPRTGAVTAWTGAEALFLGGDAGPPCVDTADCELPQAGSREGTAFDPADRTWRRTADAPVVIDAHSASTVVGSTVHVLAGGKLLSYDAVGDTWTAHQGAPTGPAAFDLAEAGGRIVIVRGERGPDDPPDQVYDFSSRSWSALPEDPLGPAFDRMLTSTHAGLVLTGKPLVPSPGSEEPSLVRAAVFDLASSRWALLPDSDQLGGWRWSWTGTRMVDATLGAADGGDVGPYGRTIPMGGWLDPATGTWGRLPDAPAIGSGGWPVEALGGPLVAAEGWVFDDRQETWTRLPRPEGAPPDPGPAVWAGELLVVLGGVDPADGSTLAALSDGAWSWSPSAGAESPAGDVRGEWRLVELIRDGAPVPLPTSAKGTLVVGAGDLGGRSFCNTFRGSYRLSGSAFTIGRIGGTKMRCAPDVMAAEQAYLAALGAVDTAAVQNGELLLSGQGAELRFQRLPS